MPITNYIYFDRIVLTDIHIKHNRPDMFLTRVSKRAPFRNPFECYTDRVIAAK
jgi:hypothetical protein